MPHPPYGQVDRTFGFETAVQELQRPLLAAKVRLMRRYSSCPLVLLASPTGPDLSYGDAGDAHLGES